ncbi:histidinol-phosphate transaminase [Aliiglaciecola lipolytica]|uniref:Histidinol-phosphate aminotransferase n=1 Tax=Aliiglaciecola lipolytica E3 TaxID=1127673 RepID=K6YS30_9ALTE|nr:histidinol-phosphate transaminase [Aliiglaciecola lipolytica]GAC14115.1 histidinol-phosphate aminotransferase [Aliiglaciecola lipolytica E3]
MSSLVNKLLCENVKNLKPYESARRLFAAGSGETQQTWLNANESPFTNPYNMDDGRFNRYPDCQPSGVINAYAAYSGVTAQNTLVSRGADEGIELLIRAFCTPGEDAVLICPPTYGMYAISAETCDVKVEKAPLKADFSLDVENICTFKDKVKLVFICSPNNPTGTSVPPDQLQAVIEHFSDSALVVVDEAYIEFNWQCTWANKLNQYPNLVILRTLSKAFALAGIRCGFTLAAPEVIQALLKVIAPYPIPEPVAQVARQALESKGISKMLQQVGDLNKQRNTLKEQLASISSVELVGDDKANFILFRCAQKNELMQYLVDNHILIRDQSKQVNLQNCLRITVGTADQNQQLMDLIFSFFKQQESAQ